MKKISVDESVGMVLGHDMTQIIPGQFKGPRFKKGHIIREEDISVLKSMGKEHIFILELDAGMLHENDAAIRIARATAGQGLKLSDPGEGKVNYIAEFPGLLEIDVERLTAINSVPDVILATLHSGTLVKAGQVVAGTRINPLVIEEHRIMEVEKLGQGRSIIQVLPLRELKAGIVITGNEVFTGRIEDKFAPVLREKMHQYGVELLEVIYTPDDADQISAAICKFKGLGADVVITGGGMSVDPDDVTPEGIRGTGAEVIKYGAPVLPGSMFMVATLDDMMIIGLPACAMYHRITVFELVFPYVLAGKKLTPGHIARLGHGGLCMNCTPCSYPHCPFGKA